MESEKIRRRRQLSDEERRLEAWINGSETLAENYGDDARSLTFRSVGVMREGLDATTLVGAELDALPLALPEYDLAPQLHRTGPEGRDQELTPASRVRSTEAGSFPVLTELLGGSPRVARRGLRAAIKAVQELPTRRKPLPGVLKDREKVINTLVEVADIVDELFDIEEGN